MFDIKRGLEILEKNIKVAPENPGVYRMIDENDKVLYVGPSDGDTPWQDEDSYYYAWDDEK